MTRSWSLIMPSLDKGILRKQFTLLAIFIFLVILVFISRKGPVVGKGILDFVEDLRYDVVSHQATPMFWWDSQMISRTGILDVYFPRLLIFYSMSMLMSSIESFLSLLFKCGNPIVGFLFFWPSNAFIQLIQLTIVTTYTTTAREPSI